MESDFYALVEKRQSCRDYDATREVEEAKIQRILEAGRLAPSACNSQPWHLIAVTQPQLLNEMADALASMGMNRWASQARAFIVIVQEQPNFTARLGGWIKNKHFPLIDCGIVASHITLAATQEGLGGSIRYALGAHSFAWLVPHHEYRDTHPEYFSFYNGRRQNVENDHWQLCLTNPDLVDIVVKNAREILKANPDKKILSISQNDNPYNCQCENCLKSDAEEGSPVGTLIKFVNRVAEILEPEFPDVMFDILAYHYTRPASRKTQTRHNVCVRLCASSTCFAHPYDKCDDRSRAVKHPNGKTTVFIDDLIEWSKVCNRLYVWDYTSNFPLYPMPFANWRVLQPNLQTMAKHNVKGVFEEANCAANGGVDFNELRTYLLCKLMWNPDCDIDAYRKEFMEYYYGEAAPHLDKYLNMLCDFVEKENYHLYIQDIKRPDYLSEELLITYNDLFDKAEKAVAGDGIRLSRVQKARLSIRFVDIFWNEILSGNYNAQKINQFFTDLRAHNISRLDEWSNIERTYRAWMEGKERGVYLSTPWRYDRESIL